MAGELAQITGRVKEHYTEVAPRLLRGAPFFPIAGGLAYGLRSWLLDLTSEREDDLLFYNYLSAEKLAPFQSAAKGLDWEDNPTGAAHTLISVGGKGQPVDNRVVQYFAWKSLGEDFDGAALYDAVATDRETFLALPDHRWLLRDSLEPLRALWRDTGRAGRRDGRRRSRLSRPPSRRSARQAAGSHRGGRRGARAATSRAAKRSSRVGDLLTHVFEIRPGSRTFAADAETLTAYLRAQPGPVPVGRHGPLPRPRHPAALYRADSRNR